VKKSLIGSLTPISKSWKFTNKYKSGNPEIQILPAMDENTELAGLINKDLGSIEESMLIPIGNEIDRTMIREKLAVLIAHLMESNFEKLCQAMYRLDVPESKFDIAMNGNDLSEIPYAIADLVIEREMQKVRTRIMYKRGEL
jgi:hypothetical protein